MNTMACFALMSRVRGSRKTAESYSWPAPVAAIPTSIVQRMTDLTSNWLLVTPSYFIFAALWYLHLAKEASPYAAHLQL
jgi:hypothetical protein